MYSRYPGHRPFDPGGNRNSRGAGRQSRKIPPDAPPIPAALPAPPPPPQAGLPEGLSGGSQNSSQSGEKRQDGNLLGSLGGLDLSGIANILRSGGGGISKLLKEFSINWDAGDILMVLILLFLSLESDDDEILILLALILVMGL